MTYPRANIRFTYVQPADDDADGRAALAELMASDERWAIGEGMSNIETTRLVYRDFSRPVVIEPPPGPWWHALRAGDSIRPKAAGTAVLFSSGTLFRRYNLTYGDGSPVVWTIWEPATDKAKGLICVFNGDAQRYPGGLWVSAGDVDPAG